MGFPSAKTQQCSPGCRQPRAVFLRPWVLPGQDSVRSTNSGPIPTITSTPKHDSQRQPVQAPGSHLRDGRDRPACDCESERADGEPEARAHAIGSAGCNQNSTADARSQQRQLPSRLAVAPTRRQRGQDGDLRKRHVRSPDRSRLAPCRCRTPRPGSTGCPAQAPANSRVSRSTCRILRSILAPRRRGLPRGRLP